MAYEISWMSEPSVLQLRLQGAISLDEFEEIGQAVDAEINRYNSRMALIIDISQTTSITHAVERVREAQHYAHNSRLKWLLIVGSNKLMRLTMLVIFNLSRAQIQLLSSLDEAQVFLRSIKIVA